VSRISPVAAPGRAFRFPQLPARVVGPVGRPGRGRRVLQAGQQGQGPPQVLGPGQPGVVNSDGDLHRGHLLVRSQGTRRRDRVRTDRTSRSAAMMAFSRSSAGTRPAARLAGMMPAGGGWGAALR
jgi:hypothetical protein